jgi:hypothetical protein
MASMTSTKTTTTPVYCVNHPTTETLLHCYRCGKPVCLKCVTRTPVGMICRDCLSNQRSGYYTATVIDYALAAVVGFVLSFIGGLIAGLIGGLGFFALLIAIFYAPAAGGVIAEGIRFVIRKRRGRYIWLVGVGMVILGAFLNIGGVSILFGLLTGRIGALLNFGFWVYLFLAVGTVYARLRT